MSKLYPLKKEPTPSGIWGFALLGLFAGGVGALVITGGDALSPRGIPMWLLGTATLVASLYFLGYSARVFYLLVKK